MLSDKSPTTAPPLGEPPSWRLFGRAGILPAHSGGDGTPAVGVVGVRRSALSCELACTLGRLANNLVKEWREMRSRDELLERLAALGFDRDKLVEIQSRTEHWECDILDMMMDIAYGEEPITREMRAARARRDMSGEGERKALADVVLDNYVRDGVWTLTNDSFTGLLKLRYMSLPAALRALGFANTGEAVAYYSSIQRRIYAA